MVKAFRKALIVKMRTSIALVFISLIASFDLNVYRNQIDDFIHYKPEEGVFVEGYQQYSYVSTNTILQGWEIEVSHFDKARGLKSMAALSYVEGSDVIADTSLPFIPPLTLNASLSYETDYLVVMDDFLLQVTN